MKRLIISTTAVALVITLCISASAATVAYWRFENGTNGWKHPGDQDGWYTDTSGSGNPLSSWWEPARPTYTNHTPFSIVPQTGATNDLAMDFVPANDLGVFTANTINDYAFTNQFTVECTAKMRGLAWQVAVGKDGEPGLETLGWWDQVCHIKFRAESDTDHKIHLGFWSTPSNWVSCMTPYNYEYDKWYAIAGVCDGTQAYLYVKEETDSAYELDASAPLPSGTGMVLTNGTWTVGRGMWHGSPSDFCDGIIDEVRISDVALSPSEFLAIPEPGAMIAVVGALLALFARRR